MPDPVSEQINAISIIYVFWTACSLVHTIAHVVAGRVLGVEVEEVGLFWGPRLGRIRIGGIPWVVRLVPGPGGYVKFREKGGDELGRGFKDLHPLRRILIIAAGSLALVAVALACLGPVGGMRSVWRGFAQIVRGGLAPTTIGASLVRSLLPLIRDSPFPVGLGVVAAKRAAANLLPLPPLDGGQILWILVEWRARLSERIGVGVAYAGIGVCLLLGLVGRLPRALP